MSFHSGFARRLRRAWAPAAVALGLAISGCDGLLDVELPGSTPAEAVNNPALAALLVLSAQGKFEDALNIYVFNAGHIAGELVGGQSALGAIPFQRRDVRSLDTQNDNLYETLSTARWTGDNAMRLVGEATDAQVANKPQQLGRAALYTGFSFAVFGEGFCRSAFDLGSAVTPAQMFQSAEDRFTTAIQNAQTANDAPTLNAARVGRARVRMALGNTAGALADAELVPAGFVLNVTRSAGTNARRNEVFFQNVQSRAHSIDPNFWNLEWMGVPDPRVRLVNTNTIAQDGLTPLWNQTKFTALNAPIRLASYVEAQLIIAEVVGGERAVGIINALHTAAGIPPFASTDANEIRAQVIEERRREFFLEGRRLGDLRRFGGFEQWTWGTNPFVGYEYGRTQCFPLPDVEVSNNPNVQPTDGRS